MTFAELAPGLWFVALAVAGAWVARRLDGDLPRRVILAALGLTLVVLAGPLLAGRILAGPDMAVMPPFGDDVEAGRRAALTDPSARILPAMIEVRRALARGELPLWNPRPAAGTPLLAAPEAQVAQPLVMAAWPFAPGPALGVVAALQVFIALLFGWLALRDLPLRDGLPLGDGAAFAGAAFYAATGVLPAHGWPEAHVAALFPALVYALGAAERRDRRRDHVVAVGVGVAILLAGAPRTSALALAAAGAIQLARLARRPPPERLRGLWRILAVTAVAAGLAAPVLLPTLRWLPATEGGVLRAAERIEVLREDPLGLRALRGTWSPPRHGDEAESPRGRLARGSALFLAAIALVHGPVRRRLGDVWAVSACMGLAAVLVVAEPAPLGGVLRYLHLAPREPGGAPALFLVHFAVAGLAVVGLTAFGGARRLRPGLFAIGLAGAAAAALLWASSGSPGASLALAGVALAASVAAAASAAPAAPLLIGLVLAEVALGAIPRTVPARSFYPPHPLVAALGDVAEADRGLRAIAVGPRLPPAAALVLGLSDPRGVAGQRPGAYADLIRALEQRPGEWQPADHPLYDLLAVRALLPAGTGVPEARPSALPLLFLPHEARPVGPSGWLPQVLAVEDFRRTAIVQPSPEVGVVWSARQPDAGDLTVGAPGSTRLAARYELAESRLLASSIYQDGGWRLLLDGRPTPTIVANGPFVAAWLPPGAHRIDLVYRPPGLTAGLAWAALAAILGGLWLGVRHRFPGSGA